MHSPCYSSAARTVLSNFSLGFIYISAINWLQYRIGLQVEQTQERMNAKATLTKTMSSMEKLDLSEMEEKDRCMLHVRNIGA